MRFAEALELTQNGISVRRQGWNGANQFVYLETGLVGFEPVYVIHNAQGRFQPGWVPSMGDMNATDWETCNYIPEAMGGILKTTLPRALTSRQKLEAISLRFYQGTIWVPEAGHYYTTSRPDLELYRIVKIENETVFTEYCHNPGTLAEWPESEFTTAGFGPRRVWVPNFVLGLT